MCQKDSIIELRQPSLLERYTCAGIFCAVFSVWWKFSFVPESQTPGVDVPMHSYKAPLALTVGYLISLPLLEILTKNFLKGVDVKSLLKESMVLYNVSQVALNAWMVWRFVDAVVNKNHPFIGDIYSTSTGASYVIWVHYCDKYLEFFDTYFMVLRGRMDQVRRIFVSTGKWLLVFSFKNSQTLVGFIFACLPSFQYCMGMVCCTYIISWWGFLLRCPFEFMDSCVNVCLLYFSTIKNPLPVEKIPHSGSIVTIHFGSSIFFFQFQDVART